MTPKKGIIIFFILNLFILSCNSDKKNPTENRNIGSFTFSFPNGTCIFYNSPDSIDGEIRFKNKFIANFTTGYFNPMVLKKPKDGILKKDSVANFIIRTVIHSNNNNFDILFYAWDITTLTTQILNEKRYMGIIISASDLSENQKGILLQVLKTFNCNSLRRA